MKRLISIVFIISIILSSCNNNSTNNVPLTGATDSAAIAQDTAMQVAIENSYEYIKTLIASEKLAYDIIAYGGSAIAGEYAIIRRGADNKSDTIAHGTRRGTVSNTFMADLNNNGNNEIYIILQSTGGSSYGNVIAYEIDKQGKATQLNFPDPTKDNAEGYMGKDSIYTDDDFLIRRYPVYKKGEPLCCPTGGWRFIYYALNEREFKVVKQKN